MSKDPMQQVAVETIAAAAKHLRNGAPMQSSALVSHEDALSCLGRGDYRYAAARALDSLGYSVGILHADHKAAKAAFDAAMLEAKRHSRYLTPGERKVLRLAYKGLPLYGTAALAIDTLVAIGFATVKDGDFQLTPSGKACAATLVV